jgi:hypothetical protein
MILRYGVIFWAVLGTGCGVIAVKPPLFDSFTLTIDLDEAVRGLETTLKAQGILPSSSSGLPDVWPAELPNIRYTAELPGDVQGFDLNPEDEEEAEKYKLINEFSDLIRRIEINHLILRLEKNTMSIAVPPLTIRGSNDYDANPEDPDQWQALGSFDGADLSEVTDVALNFAKGGENFLNTQLLDEAKKFTLQAQGSFTYDTAVNPRKPSGAVTMRVILDTTVFVDTDNIGAIRRIINEVQSGGD